MYSHCFWFPEGMLSVSFNLVLGPRDPRLVLNPSGTRIVSQGDPLTLTCNAQSESKKLEFSWRKKVS
jgi:hypothetical protein